MADSRMGEIISKLLLSSICKELKPIKEATTTKTTFEITFYPRWLNKITKSNDGTGWQGSGEDGHSLPVACRWHNQYESECGGSSNR